MKMKIEFTEVGGAILWISIFFHEILQLRNQKLTVSFLH